MLDYAFEADFGDMRVAGVDEVGRGPWAGPVTAAAVILSPSTMPDGLHDSKKLSKKRREVLSAEILEVAEVGIGYASVEEIDEINILSATLLAMERAIEALPQAPDVALIDGNRVPKGLQCQAHAVVKGDGRVASIAAASIVAKVSRDRLMTELAHQHPGYGWETNMGYGTSAHRVGLLRNGVTPHHRRSFRPIHKMLSEDSDINL